MPVDSGAVVREARVDTLDRPRHETSAAVDALAELRDRDPALDLVDMAVLHVCHEQPRGVRTEIDDADKVSATPIDRVFEHGFHPLQGGFHASPASSANSANYQIFDQWVEVLPTDQVVPVEVRYDPATGRQIAP